MKIDTLISKLAKLADELDSNKFHSAADAVDVAIEKLAADTYVDEAGVTWTMIGPSSFPSGYVKWQNSKGMVQNIKPESKPGQISSTSLEVDPNTGLKREEPVPVPVPENVEDPKLDPTGILGWMNENIIEPGFGHALNNSEDQDS